MDWIEEIKGEKYWKALLIYGSDLEYYLEMIPIYKEKGLYEKQIMAELRATTIVKLIIQFLYLD